MIPLAASFKKTPDGETFVGRLTEDRHLPFPLRDAEILILRGTDSAAADGFKRVLRLGGERQGGNEVQASEALGYLADGDILRINESAGELRVMYRRESVHNVLFFTERCNSRCLMCSQPPRDIDDGYLVDDVLEAIPLMSIDTQVLCITGGEPTILGWRLIEVMRAVTSYLPQTALHMLSNGRSFAYRASAKAVSDVGCRDLMIGVPLYADVAAIHNFVVQAQNAFDQTISGISNLARFGVPVEIRFVIHRQTVGRMVQTAAFISRNLPFVSQVALMGLEMTGFTRSNVNALWIDPWEYREALAAAVHELDSAGIRVMIYNLPLCLLPSDLWPYAQRSISDWKNLYMPECESCVMRPDCAGFFASATFRYSEHISPFQERLSIADGIDHLV